MPDRHTDLVQKLGQQYKGLDRVFLPLAVNWAMAGDGANKSEEEIEKRVLAIMEDFNGPKPPSKLKDSPP